MAAAGFHGERTISQAAAAARKSESDALLQRLEAAVTGGSDLPTPALERLIAIDEAMDNDSPDWMKMAVAFVQGDASSGIHNPAYTDALLDALEAELDLGPEIAPTILPEDLGIEIRPTDEPTETEPEPTAEVNNGLTTPSIVLLALVGLVMAVAAYAFFLREARA